jgi:threonine/homoserine/homoserine lactone efflux protein
MEGFSSSTLAALFLFAFSSSFTPGPNNMMLLASGVNFGVRRTIPHMAGVDLGFTGMVALIGLGLGQVFVTYPPLYTALKLIGIGYLLWLAWRIAHAGPVKEGERRARPMTFFEACAFQWVNPKAWMMPVTAISTYRVFADTTLNALYVALNFAVANLPSVLVWVWFGAGMRKLLSDPVRVLWFNRIMAGLLVLSLWPLIVEFF